MAAKRESESVESVRGPVAPPRSLIPSGRTDTNVAAVLRLARQALASGRLQEAGALPAVAREVDWSVAELSSALAAALGASGPGRELLDTISRLGRPACVERVDAAIDRLGDPENPILGPAGP